MLIRESRLNTVRERYVKLIVNEPKDSEVFEIEYERFLRALDIICNMTENMTIDGVRIRQWFIENTTMEDWASFFMEYDYFIYINGFEKDWTRNINKKVRYMRELFSQIVYEKEK